MIENYDQDFDAQYSVPGGQDSLEGGGVVCQSRAVRGFPLVRKYSRAALTI